MVNRRQRDAEMVRVMVAGPPEKMRQNWAALAASQHKFCFMRPRHSQEKPRKWRPDAV